MNLRLYDAHISQLGGGEKYLASLAEALSERHKVTLILDQGVGRTDLEARIRRRLDTVTTCYGDGHDAEIVLSNVWPINPRALAFVLQIAYGPITMSTLGRKALINDIRGIGKDLVKRRLLRRARNAPIVLVYSQFVRNCLMKNHGIDAEVLYPPVSNMAASVEKKNVVLSVGRFFARNYNVKRHDVLIEAFKRFHKIHPDWSLRLVGGISESEEEEAYLLNLQFQAQDYPITFFVNVPSDQLRQHYAESKLYWHATGYGTTNPESMESFGISVGEAMSAGCVPLAHFSGGPKEIIWGHECGMLWQSIDDLVDYSHRVASGRYDWDYFSANSRKRSEDFSYRKFADRALDIFKNFE